MREETKEALSQEVEYMTLEKDKLDNQINELRSQSKKMGGEITRLTNMVEGKSKKGSKKSVKKKKSEEQQTSV